VPESWRGGRSPQTSLELGEGRFESAKIANPRRTPGALDDQSVEGNDLTKGNDADGGLERLRWSWESRAYVHFVDPNADWQFVRNVILHCPTEGELVLDILTGNRVGGIEFVDRL
jgi:hypothetical protein